jgi:hypothetical protein
MARSSFSCAGALALLAALGCNDATGTGGVEDKSGVNEIPPGQNTSAGSGGEGGGTLPCADPADCNDDNDCTVDACVNFMCQNTSIADDGDPCTFDTCNAGMASNAPSLVLFSESFATNDAMWTLTGQWAIGAAVASAAALDGGNDPATDHSTTDDNGVAGTVIGDLVQPTGGVSEYLTSPPIPLGAATANDFFTLRFWRWLNADTPPVMTATVEVQDSATTFVPVWTSVSKIIDAPPRGIGWFEVRIDVTSAVRDAIAAGVDPQIRFGFVKNGSAVSVGGWTVDDVSLEAVKAPVDDQLCTIDSCAEASGMAVAVSTPMPAVDDMNACSTFVCDAGSFDNPQQQEPMPGACGFP